MIRLGAKQVAGIEPSEARIKQARKLIAQGNFTEQVVMFHTADTSHLPFRDGEFPFVLVNAVLEHIPEPRDPYIKEIWRVLEPGGHMLINETPNKYFLRELHTTDGLWFNHWLPSEWAHKRAVRNGRFASDRTDWDSSGWRGLSYFEITRALQGYKLIPELTHRRHCILASLGIPASIIDPYPTWVFQKLRV
jgi:SAM-dependent methyltransferase